MKNKEISCRITRTLIMYVQEKNNGTLGTLLDDLPFDEAYLSDANNWISHEVLQTLYQRMVNLLDDPKAVYHMTLSSARFRSLGILDRIVKLIGSPKLIYKQAPLYNKFLKLNGSVFIHEIKDNSAILEDRYHDGTQKTRFDCDYTRGILAGVPTIFGLPEAKVEEIKCQVSKDEYGQRIWPDKPVQGCSGCFYHITWSTGKMQFFKQLLFSRSHNQKAIEDLARANQLIQTKYDEVKNLLEELETKNQQLSESEGKYRLLTENMSDSIWIMDLKTLQNEYISPAIFKNRGYTPEEIKELSLDQVLFPESYELAIKILGEELEREKDPSADPKRSRTFEIQETVKDGGYIWSETTVSFLRDQAGVPNKIMGVTRYIDERKKAERKIAENEKKYRNLFENGSDLICIHDLEGKILDTNLQYKEEYGWKHDDIIGVNIRGLMPEHYQTKFDEYMTRIIQNKKDKGYLKGISKTGQKVILEYRNQLIFDDNNQPVAVQGSGRDVTEQFMAQKALKESEDRYKNLVRNAPAGIYEFDLQKMKLISVNDVICEYTGYSEAELLNLNPFDLLDDDGKKTLNRVVDKVFSTHPKELTTEYKIYGKNNKQLWVMSNTRFFYESGVPKQATAVVNDMTQVRKAEEERRNLEIQLQQAHKMEAIGTLAGGIAHDFNNILAGILGYCDLLKQNIDKPEKAHDQIGQIKQGAKRAAELVKQILTFSRKEEYEKHPQTLPPIVQEVMKLLRSSIPVTIDIKETINSKSQVMADPAKIHQVIMNLCTNAYHAMNETGGTLSLNLTDTQLSQPQADNLQIPAGNYVKLVVSDTGHGMDPDTLERIFEPYFTTKEIGKGTGMGLSLVYAIITEHNGVINAQSVSGKGSVFTVYLPETQNALEEDKKERHETESARGNERIMIVDDEPSILESTRELLSDYGYKVDCFSNGKLALKAFKEDPGRFDLVLTDMTMPEMTGEVLAKNIFNLRKDLPIILCSGYNEEFSEARAREMGITKFITKPVIDQPLPDIIREVLNAKTDAKKD